MNCARCGATNDPGMNFCISCGNALQYQPPPPPSSFDQPPPPYGKPAPPPYGWQQPSSPLGQPSSPGQTPQPGYAQPPQPYGQTPPGYAPPASSQQLFGAYMENIPNYLVPAILSTILCCVPAGIVSIIYAVQVNNKKQVGDLAGAAEASSKAQTWFWVSFGLGLIVIILNVIVAIAGA